MARSSSISAFPARSPTPSAVACTRSAPAAIAARQFATASPRSRWPCQSSATSALDGSKDPLAHEPDQAGDAGGRGMAGGVGEADPPGPRPDRREAQRGERIGVGATRVLRHEHDGDSGARSEGHGALHRAEHALERPPFSGLPHRRGAEKRRRLDRKPALLRQLGDGLEIRFHGAGGAIEGEWQAGGCDLAGEQPALRQHARAGRRKPDGGGADPELRHEVNQAAFELVGGFGGRRALEPVAERLVVELDADCGRRPVRRSSRRRGCRDPWIAPRSGDRPPHVAELVEQRARAEAA